MIYEQAVNIKMAKNIAVSGFEQIPVATEDQ
jgi:hypothetical protein